MQAIVMSSLLFLLSVFLVATPLLFHEVGHWVALTRYKVPTVQFWCGLGPVIFRYKRLNIGLLPIGGAIVPEPARFERLRPWQRLIVALSGPFASFLYGAILWCSALLAQDSNAHGILLQLSYLNFILAGVNLLPIPPLDGFHALVSYREMTARPMSVKTKDITYRLGNGLLYGVGFLVVGWFLFKP